MDIRLVTMISKSIKNRAGHISKKGSKFDKAEITITTGKVRRFYKGRWVWMHRLSDHSTNKEFYKLHNELYLVHLNSDDFFGYDLSDEYI